MDIFRDDMTIRAILKSIFPLRRNETLEHSNACGQGETRPSDLKTLQMCGTPVSLLNTFQKSLKIYVIFFFAYSRVDSICENPTAIKGSSRIIFKFHR